MTEGDAQALLKFKSGGLFEAAHRFDVIPGGLQPGLPVLDGEISGAQFLPRLGFVDPVFGLPAAGAETPVQTQGIGVPDRKSTRLNSSHVVISYAVFCLKKKNTL